MADVANDGQSAIVKPNDLQPVLLPPGSGRVLDFLGVTHRLTSEQSGGSIYIFESSFDPGGGNRLHVHSREDEISYVLEGALEVRLRDRTAILEAGGLGRLPKNLPHAIRNPLETPSRYLFLAVPGGLDRWFDAVAAANLDGSLTDPLFRKLSEDHGIGWLE
jgi:quercetin dioxygenase-like cupin family protein